MYTATIEKLLFPSRNGEWKQHYPNMVVSLLGQDTDLVALAGILRENGCKRDVVAAVIVWIVEHRPDQLEGFIKSYGKTAEVYNAVKDWFMPPALSVHLGILDKVAEMINPDAKLCSNPRLASMGLQKDTLTKAPVKEPEFPDKRDYSEGFVAADEESIYPTFKAYFEGKDIDTLFVNVSLVTHSYREAMMGEDDNGNTKRMTPANRRKAHAAFQGIIAQTPICWVKDSTKRVGWWADNSVEYHAELIKDEEGYIVKIFKGEWGDGLESDSALRARAQQHGGRSRRGAQLGEGIRISPKNLVVVSNYKQVIAAARNLEVPHVDAAVLG